MLILIFRLLIIYFFTKIVGAKYIYIYIFTNDGILPVNLSYHSFLRILKSNFKMKYNNLKL